MCNKDLPPKISIIIPLYNSEPFLLQCLNSIKEQTFRDFEIIIINDFSTDSSLKIASEYKEKYKAELKLFKIINLGHNRGVSYARNIGLLAAKGNYICFLDSDDFIKPDFLEIMYKKIIKYNSDIVCCNYYYSNKKNKIKKNLLHHRPGLYASVRIIKSLIKDTTLHFFVWNKMFKKDIILKNQIFFENRCFEDMLFTLKAFYFSSKVLIIDDILYYYRKHNSSLTHFMALEKLNDYLISLKFIKKFLFEENTYKKYTLSYRFLVVRFLFSCLYRVPEIYIKSNFKINIFKCFYFTFSFLNKLIFSKNI